jgi:Flp pilus assembly protein TadG
MRTLPNLTTLLRDERGHVATVFALTLIPVFGLTSLAIDFGRALTARTELQAIVDIAAVTAASATGNDQALIAAATSSFNANWAAQVGGAGPNPPAAQVSVNNGVVTVSASGSVTTTLAQMIGFTTLPYTVQSRASSASGKQLELSMMIDLTGSMGASIAGQTKIASLKAAADDLLSILFPNNATTSSNVRVAIAPFADYVNAGPYAQQATGLSSSSAFTPIANLGRTRQGRTNHVRYTGVTANTAGSQAGATTPSGVLNASGATAPSSNNGAGGTFNNGYCSTPTQTVTANIFQQSGRNAGEDIDNSTSMPYSGVAPPGFLRASSSAPFANIQKWDWGWNWDSTFDTSGYYVPILNNATGLTLQRRTADGQTTSGSWVYNRTGNIGVRIGVNSGQTPPSNVVVRQATSQDSGYWEIIRIRESSNNNGTNDDFAFDFVWRTSGFYLPVYQSLSTTTTVAGCESAPPQGGGQTSSLITCVTERTGAQAYTDASPTMSPVQPFNAGNSSIDNYSEDGRCWVAGRELPSIIPLTNDKSTLTSFFANARIGGATPGHIGIAWSWYMLSPNWSNVFTGSAMPTAYNSPNVLKVAVLMTDGEYNIHYASATAREQALQLCSNMKAAGITVFTVGFGFSASATPSPTDIAEQRAKDLLTQCASTGAMAFFPYDGAQLRTFFQQIGSQLMSQVTTTTARITD